jgi:hypothetical protein
VGNGKPSLNIVPQSPYNHINPSTNSNQSIGVSGLQSPYNNTNPTQIPSDRQKSNYYSSSNPYVRKAESYPSEAAHYASAGKKSAQI